MFLLSKARLCVFVVSLLAGGVLVVTGVPLQLFAWNDYVAFFGEAAIVGIGAYIGTSATDRVTAWLRSRRSHSGERVGVR